MIFAEAVTVVPDYRRFVDTTNAPVLANMTEFGVSPLATVEELASAGVSLVLYPSPPSAP